MCNTLCSSTSPVLFFSVVAEPCSCYHRQKGIGQSHLTFLSCSPSAEWRVMLLLGPGLHGQVVCVTSGASFLVCRRGFLHGLGLTVSDLVCA